VQQPGLFVRHLAFAVLLLVSSVAARAAEITVYSPGIANGPLRKLAERWMAQSGNTVTITGGNVGRIRTAVQSGAPGDIVLAPPADLADLSARLVPGSDRKVGRILFGVVVKAGGAHPDISTRDKFVAFARQAGTLAYANPAVGSLSGAMVEDMLKRPEFAGVRPLPIKGMIGDAIVRGDAQFGGGAISEEVMAQGAEVVGPFPDSLGLHIDISGAVLQVAAAPKEAQEFLAYITAPGAAAVWKAGGIVQP
jgi:molybdate transport system substrate-binding protein